MINKSVVKATEYLYCDSKRNNFNESVNGEDDQC